MMMTNPDTHSKRERGGYVLSNKGYILAFLVVSFEDGGKDSLWYTMSDSPYTPKILIVDDSPTNILVLKNALARGRQIIFTTKGEEVLGIAQDQKPDLILLDIMMPGMDGYEVCRQLKANVNVRDIPVLFVTALMSGKDELKGLELGAIDYITKPFDSVLLNVRVQNHLELKHRQDKLQQLLTKHTQLIEDLEKSRDDADMANRAKSAFLATMSHEVRTPLNAIIGMTDLALRTDLNTEQRQYLEIAMQSSESLLELLNNILDFAKIESGKLNLGLVEFDPMDVIESLCSTLSVSAHQRDLELLYDIDPTIPSRLHGDPLRLRQILLNLINNAIKFTKKGEIVVRLRLEQEGEDQTCDEQRGVRLHFMVSDTGRGVLPEQKSMIFDRFVQGDEYMTRSVGGTGLGLAISQQIVKLMGGRIWVESAGLNQGSVFHFTALFGEVPQTWGKHFFTTEANYRGLRILLYDPHTTARLMVSRVLTLCGAEIIQTKSCAETQNALQNACNQETPFHLLLLECGSPDPDRTSLDQWLQENAERTGPICVMLRSIKGRRDLPCCEALKIVRSLIKPIKRHDLIRAVNEALGRLPQGGAESCDVKDTRRPPSAAKKLPSIHTKSMEEVPILNPNPAVTLIPTRLEFLESAIQVLEDLASSLAIGDTDKVLPHLRWVKDNAASIGAERLKNSALRMLITIRKGKMADASEQLECLRRDFEAVADTITADEESL